jgi:hypothetical protein
VVLEGELHGLIDRHRLSFTSPSPGVPAEGKVCVPVQQLRRVCFSTTAFCIYFRDFR